jgi:hypothetical protein
MVPFRTDAPSLALAGDSAILVDQASGTVGLDARKLPAPADVYDADLAWASFRDGTVSLWFGKETHSTGSAGGRLRTRVEMRYSFEAFLNNFWSNSRDFHAALTTRARARRGFALGGNRPDPTTLEAEKDHSLWATLELISRTGNEACIDFYHCPPAAAVWYLKEKDFRRLHFDPVLRVLLTTDELYRLFEAAIPIAEHVKPLLGNTEAL